MEIRKLNEAGYSEALKGLNYSYMEECRIKDGGYDIPYNAHKRAIRLAKLDGGHNKFLESIIVWVDIRTSLKMWKQLDTYRMCTKQSKSTMHTLLNRLLTQDDFDAPVSTYVLADLNSMIEAKNYNYVYNNLPSSYLQTRLLCLSYKTIRNIVLQRQRHRLKEWIIICDYFKSALDYPGLLGLEREKYGVQE